MRRAMRLGYRCDERSIPQHELGAMLVEGGQWDQNAARMLVSAKVFANAGKLADLDDLTKLEQELQTQEASLSMAARGMLDMTRIGIRNWAQGAIRAESRSNLTLAALQLLQSEREEGPIASTNDLRFGSFAIDPSNGMPFVFDPAKRQLSAAEGSALAGEDPVQLPDW